MTLVRKALFMSIALSAGALSVGYGLRDLWNGSAFFILTGIFWGFAASRNWGWIASPALAGYIAAAAFGTLRGLPSFPMLAGVVAALAAWDLHRFEIRLKDVNRDELTSALERAHLKRILITSGLGLGLSTVGRSFQLNFSFGVVVLLTLLMAFSLSRMMSQLKITRR